MSNVAHKRVLVSHKGAESYRGQSSWLVVLRGQSFFMVSLLDCRGQWWWSLVLRDQPVVLVVLVNQRG